MDRSISERSDGHKLTGIILTVFCILCSLLIASHSVPPPFSLIRLIKFVIFSKFSIHPISCLNMRNFSLNCESYNKLKYITTNFGQKLSSNKFNHYQTEKKYWNAVFEHLSLFSPNHMMSGFMCSEIITLPKKLLKLKRINIFRGTYMLNWWWVQWQL